MAKTLDVPTKRKVLSYRYVAATNQGKLVKGTIKATNEVAAERLLIGQGYRPVNVEVAPSMFSLEEALPTLFRVKPRDVIVFSRQLATLLRSGISLLPALEILQGQVTTSRVFKKILETIANDLGSGSSFSQAISKHPKAFSDIYCRTIAVGEQSGNLETVLNRMADYHERQGAVAKKIGRALTYPLMIMGVGIVVVIILMTVVMPQLLGMFTAMNVDLPLPTKILIWLTNFLTANILYLVIAAVVLAALALWLIKQPSGRRILDRLRLTVPIIGPPTLMGELARFCRTMSVLVGAGLSLQEVMEMIPQSSNNRVIRDALSRVNEGLLLGGGLSEPMSRIDIFPPLLVQMVAVGEESNTLDFTLGVVADFYEVTSEEKTSAMVGMIGPLLTITMALGVGFIAISVLMPMYTLTGAFG
ncbi:MAG TPA: type II secretion system F family protein [Dehalococcoidales bacterium]|nr:type II secretion system F family protein [Dehalococcoidales bacterium]